MTRNKISFLLSVGIGLVLIVGCSQATPTPTTEPSPTMIPTASATATHTPEPTPTHTLTPSPSPTDTPQPTPTATDTPEPTFTATPSATPEPMVIIQVVDEESGEAVSGAKVEMTSSGGGFEASQTANAGGQVVFAGVEDVSGTYTVFVSAQGYFDASVTTIIKYGENDVTVSLMPGVFAYVTEESADLRSGPNTVFEILGQASKGDVYPVVGQSEDAAWLVVEMEGGTTCWLDATMVSVEGELGRAEVMAGPPTPTPTPTVVPPTPRPTTAPIPTEPAGFSGVALRDSMVHLQWVLEQLGGLLDRLYHGEAQSCEEFIDYYWQVVFTDIYPDIPADWHGVYNEYRWAADHAGETNYSVFLLCTSGGGSLGELDYSVARMGVNDSLARLIPAIATANAMLGQ